MAQLDISFIIHIYINESDSYWSFSKYGGELTRSGKNRANCTVVAIAGGSSRERFTSSAMTVSSTGSPTCVIADISSIGRNKNISPAK